MVTRCGGLTPDPRFAALELLLLLLNEDPTVKGFPIRDEVIDDARQFVRHGRDRLRSAQFGPRARKQSPSGDWLFSSELAAIRNAPATRFRFFAVPVLSTLPPLISGLGFRPIHEANAAALADWLEQCGG